MIAVTPTAADSKRWLRGRLFLGGVAGLVAFTDDDGPVLCPFRVCTGLACPGCGLTRAVAHAVRGDLAGSFRLHPMAVPLVALFGLFIVLRRSPSLRLRSERWVVPAAVAVGVVLVAVWLVRWRLGLLDAIV